MIKARQVTVEGYAFNNLRIYSTAYMRDSVAELILCASLQKKNFSTTKESKLLSKSHSLLSGRGAKRIVGPIACQNFISVGV
jgi:hypothetical protein